MAESLVTTTARAVLCGRCGRIVLRGWAEGIAYLVDPQEISPAEEVAALLAGRDTLSLHGGQLTYRDETRLRGKGLPGVVVAAHACVRGS